MSSPSRRFCWAGGTARQAALTASPVNLCALAARHRFHPSSVLFRGVRLSAVLSAPAARPFPMSFLWLAIIVESFRWESRCAPIVGFPSFRKCTVNFRKIKKRRAMAAAGTAASERGSSSSGANDVDHHCELLSSSGEAERRRRQRVREHLLIIARLRTSNKQTNTLAAGSARKGSTKLKRTT